jgi:hypothetical protein
MSTGHNAQGRLNKKKEFEALHVGSKSFPRKKEGSGQKPHLAGETSV